MKKLINYIKNYFIQIGDDKKGDSIKLSMVFILFFFIALVFTIINVVSKSYILMIATASFSLLCFIDFIILKYVKHGLQISKQMFELEIFTLFSYFIISGGIEGFSIIWLIILPTSGMLFFGKKHGLILSLLMYLIIIFFMYVPLDFVYNYSQTFRIRFPFVYLSSVAVSLLLEIMREIAYKKLVALQQKYEHLYAIDALTNTYNRYGFTNAFNDLLQMDENTKICLAILDLDDFKLVNDTYGHLVGDEVLKAISSNIKNTIKSNDNVFRWGGEEFAILFHDIESGEVISTCEKIRKNIENLSIKIEDIEVKVTISLGLIITKCLKDKVELEKRLYTADNLLYEAKAKGKNCIKYLDYTN